MYRYIDNKLYCEDVLLKDIAEIHGTPLYLYSSAIISKRALELKNALADIDDTLIAYSVKVNNNLNILKLMTSFSFGADIISAGELYKYLKAGGDPKKVVFAGVAKSHEEIAYALDSGILMFNAESIPEIIRINEAAAGKNIIAPVGVRINPDVEAGTHAKITTGKKGVKFGISVQNLLASAERLKNLKNINLMGIDVHIGSQILSVEPFIEAYSTVARVISEMRKAGFDIKIADLGGGFGIPYNKKDAPFDFNRYKVEAAPILKSMGTKIILEPGRFLVGESGVLLLRVEYIKEEWGKTFVITNGGMNDYIRYAMYDAYNDFLPLTLRDGFITCDIVGTVCETSDIFAAGRKIPTVKEGDFIALVDAGAYGFSMASRYNARPLAAEVLVDRGKVKLIRRRESLEYLTETDL
ncbi:MAG: diaminopimelate decarboxylase [Deferribacteraceae bacterium]|jgi:diaminopimelate decarboxylase|nr:diaminopimelate decarboxylase [Deferribacteraceae bacterium]